MIDWPAIGAVVAIILAVAGWLVRSPKESVRELEQRVATLEGALNAMGREYAGHHARHDQLLVTLNASISKLTDRFDAYVERSRGHRP